MVTGFNANGGYTKPLIFVESSTANLFHSNVATGTDTLGTTTGFGSYRSAILYSSTEQAKEGTRSLKVVTPGSLTYEGVAISVKVTPGISYTCKVWFYAPVGAKMSLKLASSAVEETKFEGINDWYEAIETITPRIETLDVWPRTETQQAITYYIDKLEVAPTV